MSVVAPCGCAVVSETTITIAKTKQEKFSMIIEKTKETKT